MQGSPHQLRQQAEHCRELARTATGDRIRRILSEMANEYDEEARELTRNDTATIDIEHDFDGR